MKFLYKYALPSAGIIFSLPVQAHELSTKEFYGLIAISSEVSDYSTRSITQGNDSYIKNNASRVGLKGRMNNDGISSVIYLVELGINTVRKHENDTIFLREYYTGIENYFGNVLIGYTNTPTKLAQGNIDTFNDLLDMKDLVPGERVKEQLVLNTASFHGLSLSMSSIIGDISETDNRSGHSLNLAYKNKNLYLSYAQDSMEHLDTLHRGVINFRFAGWTYGYLYAFNQATKQVEDEEAHVVSIQYRYSDLAIKLRVIDSSFTQEVSNSYNLELGDVSSSAFGIDYFFNESTILFGYIAHYRDASKANLDLFGVGVKLNF